MPTTSTLPPFRPFLGAMQQLFETPALRRSSALRVAAEAWRSHLAQFRGSPDLVILPYHATPLSNVDDAITVANVAVVGIFLVATVSGVVDPLADYLTLLVSDLDGNQFYDNIYSYDSLTRAALIYAPTTFRPAGTGPQNELEYFGAATGTADMTLVVSHA